MEEKNTLKTALSRIADANQKVTMGSGLDSNATIPLCRFHNRSLASELSQQLQASGIRVRLKPNRLYVEIHVAFEDRHAAMAALAEFKTTHCDSQPRKFSRDYDFAFVIMFIAIVIGAWAAFVPAFSRLTPVAILLTGVSLAIVVERWHRQYRLHSGLKFSIYDIVMLTLVVALNVAVWRAV